MANRSRFPEVMAGIGAAIFLIGGLAALTVPRAFYDNLATFPPYNEHFVQDIGAFQIGLGAVLFLARGRYDGLGAALLGTGIGSFAHTISHVIGTDLGGTPARDIPTFAVLTIALLAGGWMRVRPGRP